MKLVFNELKFFKRRYLLIEMLIILMLFMVIFLIGLTNGLSRDVGGAIEEMPAKYYLVNDESEGRVTFSKISKEVEDSLKGMDYTTLTIQKSSILDEGDKKLDVMYFAIEKDSFNYDFVKSALVEGKPMAESAFEVVLDDRLKNEGIKLGDTVEDGISKKKLTVVGFVKDTFYSYTSVGFVTKDAYEEIIKASGAIGEVRPQAILFDTNKAKDLDIKDYRVQTKKETIEAIPGYTVQRKTLLMIIWILVGVSSAILGVFFYIVTLQKRKEFGVMKAIGMTMSEITAIQLKQVLILSFLGIIISSVAVVGISYFLPVSLPFFLKVWDAVPIVGSFVGISILSTLISVRQISKIDPIEAINGGE